MSLICTSVHPTFLPLDNLSPLGPNNLNFINKAMVYIFRVTGGGLVWHMVITESFTSEEYNFVVLILRFTGRGLLWSMANMTYIFCCAHFKGYREKAGLTHGYYWKLYVRRMSTMKFCIQKVKLLVLLRQYYQLPGRV